MPEALSRFILKWGDMGGQWGVNRTIAQIHALLFLSEAPMHAEQIAETLGVARSNVSNSLKELQQWKIVERVPVPGDRREHFVAETDVLKVALKIAEVRKDRELRPAIQVLEDCVEEAEQDRRISQLQRTRLKDLYEFSSTVDQWHTQMLKVPAATIMRLIRLGDKVVGMLGFGKK